jgi:uncharacterized protein YggU (UPF0235/DUF167 family)
MMDRRSVIKGFSAAGAFAMFCDIPDTADAPSAAGFVAALNFSAETFTGTITEPDGTVNNLTGYHGVGTLPSLDDCRQSTADIVISGVQSYPTGFTIPAGQVWELDPSADTTIIVGGNIVVNGTLRATPRPDVTHRIRFTGINEANVVGGMAMHPLPSDVGLWVDGGVLDVSGTPKTAWNTTGVDPTWTSKDELLVAPMKAGDYTTRPFTGVVPTVSRTLYAGTSHEITRSYTAEVFNMTRNVVIDSDGGRGHIMIINATRPQRLEFAELVNLGPAGKLGRYPLHIHMNGSGTEGSTFRGNVAKNCGNHAFVPHRSNGIDMSYSIAYKTKDHAFWWDLNDESERVRWDRCAAVDTITGAGFMLGEGVGNSCVGSVAVGGTGNASLGGVVWPEQANGDRNVWFVEETVAHNNNTNGFRVWQNDYSPHAIIRCAVFNNAMDGFSHGAYTNQYRYFQCVGFGNAWGDMVAHALGGWSARDCWIGVFRLSRHSLPGVGTNLIESSRDWPVQSVQIDEIPASGAAYGGMFKFLSYHFRCDLKRSNVTVTGGQLSTVQVANSSASNPSFTLTP